jgi:hypothetical protein
MVKKLYICRECGHVYPEELSEYIENKIQVYCEMCGTPFSLVGVDFKKTSPLAPSEPKGPHIPYKRGDFRKSKLKRLIEALNKISYLPLLIFAGIVLGTNFRAIFFQYDWLNYLIKSLIIGLTALFITFYDINHISSKIKEEKYDEIVLDSFCYGILGCIVFGTGVILLIKGIFILIYVMANPKEEKNKVYHFGLKLKNSINYFSAKAGLIIIFLVAFSIVENIASAQFILFGLDYIINILAGFEEWLRILIVVVIIIGLCLIPITILSIDFRKRDKIARKQIFTFGDAISVIILGTFGTVIFGIGIFIFLKGLLLLSLFVGKPFDIEKFESTQARQVDVSTKRDSFKEITDLQHKEEPSIIPTVNEIKQDKIPLIIEEEEMGEKPSVREEEKKEEVEVIKEITETTSESPEKAEKKPEIKLQLHESLLPVKSEKDKKLVREYFSKIFNVLSKDLRAQIKELNIPKKERKELLNELAFLNREEQEKYIRAIIELYKELPIKLIERIRKLPNIKPKYYDKIIEQLKYMDDEEQLEFVQFLEKNA